MALEIDITKVQVGHVVGKAGVTIKEIQAKTGAALEIIDGPKVRITGETDAQIEAAEREVREIIANQENPDYTGEEGARLRAEADALAAKRSALFSEATAKREAGDYAEANRLAEEAKASGAEMEQKNKEAAAAIAKHNNEDKGKGDEYFDMHGLREAEAMEMLKERVSRLQALPAGTVTDFEVIPGAGHHSAPQGRKLYGATLEYFIAESIECTEESAGSFLAKIIGTGAAEATVTPPENAQEENPNSKEEAETLESTPKDKPQGETEEKPQDKTEEKPEVETEEEPQDETEVMVVESKPSEDADSISGSQCVSDSVAVTSGKLQNAKTSEEELAAPQDTEETGEPDNTIENKNVTESLDETNEGEEVAADVAETDVNNNSAHDAREPSEDNLTRFSHGDSSSSEPCNPQNTVRPRDSMMLCHDMPEEVRERVRLSRTNELRNVDIANAVMETEEEHEETLHNSQGKLHASAPPAENSMQETLKDEKNAGSTTINFCLIDGTVKETTEPFADDEDANENLQVAEQMRSALIPNLKNEKKVKIVELENDAPKNKVKKMKCCSVM